MPIKVLFVCHGNICRSVGAQYIFDQIIEEENMYGLVSCDSAATSTEEIGNPIYPPMRRALEGHRIPIGDHRARQLRRRDYDEYDLIIGMDSENMYYMKYILGDDPDGKVHTLMEYTDSPNELIDDPWYTRDFETAYRLIRKGCMGLMEHLRNDGILY
ncbi:MAG: low molecular weight phosphotyrosine protein phosphatase [Lachnospiraceae bacterium]|nr:low molecular weight phosphotyrosine protein phosphatase [Lachnospiraceae bacterium]